MRVCTKCGVAKSEDLFAKNGKYIRNTCQACRNLKNKESYKRHRVKRIKEVQRYYRENKEKRLADVKKWAERNPEKVRQYRKETLNGLRADVFAAYGGKCMCCGESEPIFLTIDHIGGNGRKHREEVMGNPLYAGVKFYAWLRQNEFPEGFETLCYNCNCGRHRNGGICPHKARLAISDGK